MKIEGRFIFPASIQAVWELLTDPQSLQACTPGCKRLTEIGHDEFEAALEIGVGPIKGAFGGKILMREKNPPFSYRLIIEGTGAAGFVRGEGKLTLEQSEDGGTAVLVNGDAQIGGLIAGVGQRLIEGVAKQMMGQFFRCLQTQLGTRLAKSDG
jgi:carbon monoxide dehydrogenase subunit G